MTQSVALLGSTGSIGVQVLDVIRCFPDRFRVVALAAGRNLTRLADQAREFRPERISVQAAEDIPRLRALLQGVAPTFRGEILYGGEGLNALAETADVEAVIVGLVGLIGLEPSLRALAAGKRLLTANKETFVTGGHLIQPDLACVLPIDSEHAAIHQCFKNESVDKIETLYLTSSGGPFRTFSRERMKIVTRADALKHPTWTMGEKITVDSATMMNKGLEVIEAHWLFGVPYERIQIVVHPESIIHGGLAFVDGSIVMQMGAPDMRGPIQYALTWPERWSSEEPGVKLDLLSLSRLNLEPPDPERFPCIRLAYEAGRMGGSATAVLNGANEMAVKLFLEERIGYNDIARLLEETLSRHADSGVTRAPDLNEIHALDRWAREQVMLAASRNGALPITGQASATLTPT